MIRRLFTFFALLALTNAAVAQQLPLVNMDGQTRRLPPGETLAVQPSTTGGASLNIPQGIAPTSPNDGDCWTTTSGWACRVNGVTLVALIPSPTNAALAALPSSLGRALRLGYYSEGDVAALAYVASGSACSLNAGAGDGGSQVPTSDGKCWLASFPPGGYDVRQFGARCTGSTANAATDTLAAQRAIAYAATRSPAEVLLPDTGHCAINATLSIASAVTLRGVATYNSGLIAAVTNLNPMISVAGNDVQIKNLYINGGGAGTNSSGWMIATSASNIARTIIRDLAIHDVCGALDISGYYPTIDNVFIDSAQGTGCTTNRIGHLTTGSNTVGAVINKLIVVANPSSKPLNCLLIEDTGGLWLSRSDFQICQTGTRIQPGANQWTAWATIDNAYLGDTNQSHGFVIDTGAASAIVEGLSCTACWSSSSIAGDGIWIGNTGGGTVNGIYFNGLRAYTNFANGLSINASSIGEVSITDAHMCSYGAASAGIYLASSVSGVSITNSEARPACANRPSSGGYGLFFGGSNNNIRLANFDSRGNATAIGGLPSGNSTVGLLMDQDNNAVGLTAAATVGLGIWKNYTISGTTPVTNITGAWDGRTVTIFPSAATPFATGGNICNAYTATVNVPIIATYLGCWRLK